MDTDNLTEEEKGLLLRLARQALEHGVRGQKLPELDIKRLSPRLQADGASFITLTKSGELRGCIGALEPYQPLAQDVREHAVAAALEDYRFPRGAAGKAPSQPGRCGVARWLAAGHLLTSGLGESAQSERVP
jgi:hypothetical protein